MGTIKTKLLLFIYVLTLIIGVLVNIAPITKAEQTTYRYLNMYQIEGSDGSIFQASDANAPAEYGKIYPREQGANSCDGAAIRYKKNEADGTVKWTYSEQNGKNCSGWTNFAEISAPTDPMNVIKLFTWSIETKDTVRRFDYGQVPRMNFTKKPYNSLEPFRDSANIDQGCADTLILGQLPVAYYYSANPNNSFDIYWNSENKTIGYRKVTERSGAIPDTGCAPTFYDWEGDRTEAEIDITYPSFHIDPAKYLEFETKSGSDNFRSLSKEQIDNIIEATTPPGDGKNGATDVCAGVAGAFGWLICEVLEQVDKFVSGATDVIIGLLDMKSNEYNSTTNNSKNLKTAWSTIRLISTVAMVGIALFIIIAQMLGFEFLSAYTIKKTIPKLAIAIILIQLSWVLSTTAVDIVSTIGVTIRNLIYLPFGTPTMFENVGSVMKSANIGGASQTGVTTSVLAIGLVGILTSPQWLVALAAVLLGAAIAILVTLFTLIIRKIVIIALIIIVPLAILAWVLPNTEKYWKMWWSNFSKLLLMYPMILAIMAIGRVFAYITADTNTNDAVKFIIIMVCFYGPLFLIPKSFKWGGSLMSLAGGSIHNLSSGFSKQWQQGIRAQSQRFNQAASEHLYKPGRRYRNVLGRVATGRLIPNTGSAARLTALGDENRRRKKAEDMTLIQGRLRGASYDQQGEILKQLQGNPIRFRSGDAASQYAAETGRWDVFDDETNRPRERNIRIRVSRLVNADPDFGKIVNANRHDLVPTPAYPQLSAQKLLNMDATFWHPRNGRVIGDFDPVQIRALVSDTRLHASMSTDMRRVLGIP